MWQERKKLKPERSSGCNHEGSQANQCRHHRLMERRRDRQRKDRSATRFPGKSQEQRRRREEVGFGRQGGRMLVEEQTERRGWRKQREGGGEEW